MCRLTVPPQLGRDLWNPVEGSILTAGKMVESENLNVINLAIN